MENNTYMKIAIISDAYTPYTSGVVNTVERIEEEFKKRNLDYKIFAPGDETLNDKSHHFFKSVKFLFYNKMDLSFVSSSTFKEAIEVFRPDLCHIVTEGPLGVVAARYCNKFGVPYVASYTTDLFNYFKYYAIDALKPALGSYLKKVHKNAKLNLVPSKISLEQMEYIDVYNNVIWQRGIDTNLFHPCDREVKDRKKLLYVGRIAKEKNIEVLLEMAKIFNWQEYNFELNIVGDGPILEALKKENIENVNYLGILKGEKLAEVYRNSDAFVFASEHETFGNVILEAMASGVPVISSIEGGIIENVIDGYNGIAIVENTPTEFVKKVKELFSDMDRYWQIVENARVYTSKKTWAVLTDELLTHYRTALNE